MFNKYKTDGFYDELFAANGTPHPDVQPLIDHINSLSLRDLKTRQKAAELALYQLGATFRVYGDKRGTEKIFPFDVIPRIIAAKEWQQIDAGIKQRIEALNLFIHDIYHEQKIVKDGVIPARMLESSPTYLKQCEGLCPPKDIWVHITGTDLVRDGAGQFMVLEDNLRCPSGISYVLENRSVQKRTFAEAFQTMKVRPVSDYADHLYAALRHISPRDIEDPNIVVLTPGIYNSAYFEHAYLAQQMGVTLAQGSDMVVENGRVMLRTTKGLEQVDVIYRRIDDDFLDPHCFREDSMLGIPGLMDVYRAGHVALANAPGTGVADDKAMYAYVPRIIKYYLDQEPILPNVHTYICDEEEDRKYVLAHLNELVVKAVNLSGGYGMLIGPNSTADERAEFAKKIEENPRDYIAQPTLALSRTPTLVEGGIEGRHVDIRPYALYGESVFVLPGGLTRVALKKGSLVVNSSQGGGSKDSWVLGDVERSMEEILRA